MNLHSDIKFSAQVVQHFEDLWIFKPFSGIPRRGAYPSNSILTGPSGNVVCNLRKKKFKMYHGKFGTFVKNPVQLNDNELTANSTSWWRTLTATPSLLVATS